VQRVQPEPARRAVVRSRRCLRLPDRTRENIALARQADYSIAAIGRMMDLPTSTVANAHRKAPSGSELALYPGDGQLAPESLSGRSVIARGGVGFPHPGRPAGQATGTNSR
jgi:hypothetical protein